MSNLSHLDIQQLKELKSIFIDCKDWKEVSNIQYEIDNKPKEIYLKDWMIAFLVKDYLNREKEYIDNYINELKKYTKKKYTRNIK